MCMVQITHNKGENYFVCSEYNLAYKDKELAKYVKIVIYNLNKIFK